MNTVKYLKIILDKQHVKSVFQIKNKRAESFVLGLRVVSTCLYEVNCTDFL